jgi:hypothetical protein
LPSPELPADIQPHRTLREPFQHAKPAQQPGRVRRDHQAGPDVAQLRGLLENRAAQTCPMQERSSRQAANPAAQDDDLGCRISHTPLR